MRRKYYLQPRRKALLLAGIGSCAMAAIHLLLPVVYGWKQYLDMVPHRTAVASLGVAFVLGFLLLWGGCLTVLAAVRHKPISVVSYIILYALATFWAVYVLYQSQVPPPIPYPLRKGLLVVAALITVLYLCFLLTRPPADMRHPD